MDTLDTVDLRPALADLVVARDGDDYLLGRPDLGVYVVVPEAGAVLVTALREGASLAEATARASEVAGADVDGADFLHGLAEAGLLAEGQPGRPPPAGRRIRWVAGVRPQTAARFFGPTAWTGYALAALLSVAVLVARPDLRPAIEDVWFLGDPVLSVLVFFPLGMLLAVGHEAWHWLAGRAIGVPATFRVSRRGYVLVFETDLTQIVAVPRRQRYGAFLAGMAFDAVVLAVVLVLRLLYRADVLALPPLVDRLLGVVVLAQVVQLVWQWGALFMRSDGYAVLANALRCHNLYRASWLTTKDRLWRLTAAEAAELAAISPHDRAVARWFGFVYLLGMTAVGWLLLSFGLPFLVSMVLWVANNLHSFAVSSPAFWESVAVLLLVLAKWVGPPLLGVRERRLRERGELL